MNDERISTDDNVVHVAQDDDGSGWAVWLNTPEADYDGLCVGVGQTRDEAVADAVSALEQAMEALQGPPA